MGAQAPLLTLPPLCRHERRGARLAPLETLRTFWVGENFAPHICNKKTAAHLRHKIGAKILEPVHEGVDEAHEIVRTDIVINASG
jgi:hypothetical protein